MRVKTLFLTVLLGGVCTLSTLGFAVEIGKQDIDVTLSQTYVSRYLWRGQDLYANNHGAIQPSLDITTPKLFEEVDVGLNVWGSFPLRRGHEEGKELDYTLSFARDITEDSNVSLGYTYFDFPEANKLVDLQEPWISATLSALPFLPIDVTCTVFAGYDAPVATGGPQDGWYFSWGFDTELNLPKCALVQEKQTLALGVINWGNDGVAGIKAHPLYATEFSVATTYALDAFSVTPSLHYTINHEHEINSGHEEFWAGVELGYAF